MVAWAQTQLDGELVPQTDLIKQAEEFLHAQRIVLPAPSRLGRLIATAINEAQQALYERIAQQLTEAQRQAFDELLAVGDAHTYSALADFKRSPTEPSAKQLVRLIDRYERLQALGVEQLDLSVIHPSIVQTLSRLARCYDARALRRIEPAAKRYALLVCFLFEAAGTLLDHITRLFHLT